MNFFREPVVRLTLWYVLLIMAVSVMFSSIIYHTTLQQVRSSLPPRTMFFRVYGDMFPSLHEERIAELFESKYASVVRQLRFSLVMLNLAVLVGGTLASYFLAKRTLRPIQDALDEQRRFVADASHELRTPLTAMKAEIEVALHAKDPKEDRRALVSTLEEVGKLERLTTSLLTLARHGNEDRRLTQTTFDFSKSVTDAAGRIEPLAKRRRITIAREGLPGTITGDSERLTDLFTILLDNAVKYSNEGATVLIRWSWTPSHLGVSVSDEGIGIPEADLPHVFTRFYRVDPSRSKRHTDGYGLGLSIAKQIIDEHRGSVTISSVLGKGTTVRMTLPRS